MEQKQIPLTVDRLTIGQLAPLDEKTASPFQQLVKKMMAQTNK